MRIRVNYPIGQDAGSAIVLRTSQDWDVDVHPVEADGTHAVFEIDVPLPNVALKPCLRRDGALHWAIGENYVLSANEPDPDIWPAFFGHPHGRVCDEEVHSFEGRRYEVRVYLPPGYDENTLRTFPVLYMQDGDNLFFPEEAFGGREWRVDETMDRLDRMNAVRRAIVVGVSPHDRMQDYTAPGYRDYGRFLVEALKPVIDARFRTRRGPADTVVMGSSLGGVVSLHLAWTHPDVFGCAACLSSTFGYRDDLFARIASEPPPPIRIYLDSGWPRDNFDATNAMRDLLVHRGYRLGIDVLHFSFPEGTHNEGSWAGRLHLPFQFFLGRAWSAAALRAAGAR